MACEIKLQITNYNVEKGKKENIFIPIGMVDEQQPLSIEQIANFVANLSKEDRSVLATQLRVAKAQSLTTEMVKKQQFVSNISLDDLKIKYPQLSSYDIPHDLYSNLTLIQCYRAEFNGVVYKGRTVDSKGNEVFIINNVYDAEKLFKHLNIKKNLIKFIQGNNVDEVLKNYEEKLNLLAKHYNKSIQKLIEDFLIDKNAYKTFRQGSKVYSPKRIINEVLTIITGETHDVGDKSNLQLELESIKEPGSTNQEWKFDKKNLYLTLTTFFEDFEKEYTYDQFKELNAETLNSLLKSLFANDVKLIKATVKSETKGKKIIKEFKDEKVTRHVPEKWFQARYEESFLPNNPELAERCPTYQEAAKLLGYQFKEYAESVFPKYQDKDGNSYDIIVNLDENLNATITYEKNKADQIREQSSYITLSLNNWSSIGEIYNFGYASNPIFSLTEEYKGFYIYEFHKDGHVHYAISRSIISPKTYMRTFSSLEYAKQNIDNNQDTLKECGLYSIKQHAGRPRISQIEMKGIKAGHIITTLDLELPRFEFNQFSQSVKEILNGTVANFHEKLNFIPNISSLDTPEKATAFIYLTHKALKSNQDYFQMLNTETEIVQNIIEKINKAPKISYLVEKEQYFKGRGNDYYLRILKNNGIDINFDGKFEDITVQNFIDQNLIEMIDYFNEQFGINIKTLSKDELILLSKENNLNLENKVDSVKAFVLNGQIYINTSNANAEDLFHELSHIFLGILKVSNPEAYQELIKIYQSKKDYKYQYITHRKTYQHYADQDIVEEAVADMIAADMFKSKQLKGSETEKSEFEGSEFAKMFEDIFNKSQAFVQSIPDNGLGFTGYMKKLLDENSNEIQRNMKISELIRRYINEGKISEKC